MRARGSGRPFVSRWIVVRGCVLLGCVLTAVALAAPAGAAARGSSGLGCLSGSWVSNGITSSQASGLGGIRLTIVDHGSSASAVANYNFTTPVIYGKSQFDIYIRGSSTGRFTFGGGRYHYTPGSYTEKVSVYLGSAVVLAPTPVKPEGVAHYSGLKCSASALTDSTPVPTKTGGSVSVGSSFHRA
ncbi:MAG: hypothetical protein ACLPZR_21085 [Solirubrobacteraceae bacterium]